MLIIKKLFALHDTKDSFDTALPNAFIYMIYDICVDPAMSIADTA